MRIDDYKNTVTIGAVLSVVENDDNNYFKVKSVDDQITPLTYFIKVFNKSKTKNITNIISLNIDFDFKKKHKITLLKKNGFYLFYQKARAFKQYYYNPETEKQQDEVQVSNPEFDIKYILENYSSINDTAFSTIDYDLSEIEEANTILNSDGENEKTITTHSLTITQKI